MMYDKNGIEIRTGDIVRITGAYFKCDNRVFFVSCSPGDPGWLGKDYSLHKLNSRTGELTDHNSIASWPLQSYVSDRAKSAEASAWNKKHAEIEVIDSVNTDHVRAHFLESARIADEQAEYYSLRGMFPHDVELYRQRAGFYREVESCIASRACKDTIPCESSAPVLTVLPSPEEPIRCTYEEFVAMVSRP